MIQRPSFPWPSTVSGTAQSIVFTESLMCVRSVQSTGNTMGSKTEILPSGVYILKREVEEREGEAKNQDDCRYGKVNEIRSLGG